MLPIAILVYTNNSRILPRYLKTHKNCTSESLPLFCFTTSTLDIFNPFVSIPDLLKYKCPLEKYNCEDLKANGDFMLGKYFFLHIVLKE